MIRSTAIQFTAIQSTAIRSDVVHLALILSAGIRSGMFARIAAAIAALLLAASGAPAAGGYREYRDWRVSVEAVDTGEDLRITCTISTGGDGDPTLSATISNGDALPPFAYPSVFFEESAPRGYDTVMREGDQIFFAFDSGVEFAAVARGFIDDEGFARAEIPVYHPESLFLLRAMGRADRVGIMRGSELVYSASLSGFTAAYGEMAAQCGFGAEGVI